MKTLRRILATVILFVGAMTVSAQRMSIMAMQSNARFLTDRMAYTLGIRDPYLIDEIYRINYDYIWGVNDYLDDVALGYYYDDYIAVCEARDIALRNLLGYTIWNRLVGYNYFYRPIFFSNRRWHFGIYDYDHYGPRHYFYAPPRPIARGYAGGHFFGGMAPRGGRPVAPVAVPRGGGPAPRMNHGGAPVPNGNRGGGAPAPNANRGGGTPAPNANGGVRSGSNVNSSSRSNVGTPARSGNSGSNFRSSAGGATRSSVGGASRSSAGNAGGASRGGSSAGSRGGGRR